MMYRKFTIGIILLICFAATTVSADSARSYFGNTVKLSGYCYTSPTVYLFLTGPNLPANGVALDNTNMRADQGGFTKVDVDSNDHWEYDWYTGGLDLDAGSYTVWAVNGPHDRSDLGQSEYTTMQVSLGNPSVSIATPTIPPSPGSLNISSIPTNASVVINGNYAGSTPLTVTGLDPGTYNVTFSRFNYYALPATARVEPGAVTEVSATLRPKTGTLFVNTSPAGAAILIDGQSMGISPFTLDNISAGNHTVNATFEGYTPVEEQVRVIADQIVTCSIELKKPGLMVSGITVPLPPAVATGACIVAVLLFRYGRHRSRQP